MSWDGIMEGRSWKELILEEMAKHNECWEDAVSWVIGLPYPQGYLCDDLSPTPDTELNRKFDEGFGSKEGAPFTVWTHKRVYFPVDYQTRRKTSTVYGLDIRRPRFSAASAAVRYIA